MWLFKSIVITVLLLISLNAQSFWIVANNQIDESDINNVQNLLLIFSLKKTHWENGEPIKIVTLNSNNKIHQDFVKQTLGINYNVLENIWNMKIYSGSVIPPIKVDNKEEMIKIVRHHKGAIGYIYSNHIPNLFTINIDDLK